jgi:hypothetical protein
MARQWRLRFPLTMREVCKPSIWGRDLTEFRIPGNLIVQYDNIVIEAINRAPGGWGRFGRDRRGHTAAGLGGRPVQRPGRR